MRTRLLSVVTVVGLLLSTTGIGRAQDAATIADILRRLDALEKENAALRREVQSLKAGAPAAAAPAVGPYLDTAVPVLDAPRLTVSADYLHMTVEEGGQDYVLIADDGSASIASGSIEQVEPDWGAGLRVGLAYRLPKDGWELGLRYTRARIEGSDTTYDPDANMGATLIHAEQGADIGDDDFELATADLDFDFDIVDLGLSRTFRMCETVSTRLTAGLQYSKIGRELDVIYSETVPDPTIDVVGIDRDMQLRGVGLRLGVGTDWELGRGVSLFANGAASLIRGDLDWDYRETDVDDGDVNVDISEGVTKVVPVIELGAGLSWNVPLESLALSVEIGYELISYLNLPSADFPDDYAEYKPIESNKDITLHGLFARLQLSF